jgi:hypothetical protein
MSTSHVLKGLRAHYTAPQWALFTEVRNTTGACDAIRYGDAIAVDTWAPPETWAIHGVEVKESRSDWLAELRRPEKSGPLKLFCACWYVAVPAPWNRIVLSRTELPDLWGLIEIGTGSPRVVHPAEPRVAEPPTMGFLRSLLRSAARQAESARAEEDADRVGPFVEINRPFLSREHVGLLCGHVVARPRSKIRPRRVACVGCREGWPPDHAVVEAAIDDAGDEDLRAYAGKIAVRLRPGAACLTGDRG